MGTVVSYPLKNSEIATAARLALKTADNPPPRTSIGVIRIEVSSVLCFLILLTVKLLVVIYFSRGN